MYIAGNYWNHYIGDTDDSLTLLDYLAGKGQQEISIKEIFSETGLDKLNGDFRRSHTPLTAPAGGEAGEGYYRECYLAIDLVVDLAALLLECKVSGSLDLSELAGYDLPASGPVVLTAAPEEQELISRALEDFSSAPLEYDLSELCPEEALLEMAELCRRLRQELYGE